MLQEFVETRAPVFYQQRRLIIWTKSLKEKKQKNLLKKLKQLLKLLKTDLLMASILSSNDRIFYNCVNRGDDVSSSGYLKGGKLMGERATIRKAKQRLLDQMAELEQTSDEYAKLADQLEKLTKSELNQNGWIGQLGCGIFQTAISSIASTVNVWSVLRHERQGNIVTTKSLNYAPKPTEHNSGQIKYPNGGNNNGSKKP